MPAFAAEVTHELGHDAARERLKGFSDNLRATYQDQVKDIEEEWTDDGNFNFSFKTFGMKISGTITVDDDRVKVEGSLPFAAVAFRGKIEQEIRGQLEKALK